MKNRFIKAVCLFLVLVVLTAIPAFAAKAGDVDADGKVTASDARLALRAAVGLEKYTKGTAKFTAADYDGSGAITANDARCILRIAVSLNADGSSPVTPVTGSTQYDILRSGKFYLVGSSVSGGVASPMTMGIDGNTVYMAITDGGISMGYLVKGSDIYLLNTAAKIYWKPNLLEKGVLKAAGMPDAAEVKKEVSEFGFTSLKPLSAANTVARGTVNGVACTAYIFNMSDGSKYRVYINGQRLLALESLSAAGVQEMYLRVDSISATLPTLPPSNYTKVTAARFMASVS